MNRICRHKLIPFYLSQDAVVVVALQVADQGALVAEINSLAGTRVAYLWLASREPGDASCQPQHPLLVPLQLDVPLPDDAERDHGA